MTTTVNNNGNGRRQPTPRPGEHTRNQQISWPLRAGTAWLSNVTGYRDADLAFPGTYINYERMMDNPVIALMMAVKIAPILASSWSWKVRDGTPNGEALKKWISELFDPQRTLLLGEMARAVGYGNQSLESVWKVNRRIVGGGVPDVRWEIDKFKPLNQRITQVQTWKSTGCFAGVTNAGVELRPGEVLHYPFDMRRGNWYGRPLLENMRHEFYEYTQDNIESQKLVKKLVAIIPVAKILKGLAKDESGNPVDRFTTMQTVVAGLAQAKGIVFESVLSDEADLRANPDLLKVADVDLDTLDLGSTSPVVSGMLDRRKQYHQEFAMGMILPPRSALEAQYASRADAEEHGDVGEQHTELLHKDLVRFINWYAVDAVLAYNLGDDYRGAVYAEAAPIRDKNRALLKAVLDKLLTNAATIDLVMSLLDEEQVMERLDLPVRSTPAGPQDLPTPDPANPDVPTPAAQRISQNYAQMNKAIQASRQKRRKRRNAAANR